MFINLVLIAFLTTQDLLCSCLEVFILINFSLKLFVFMSKRLAMKQKKSRFVSIFLFLFFFFRNFYSGLLLETLMNCKNVAGFFFFLRENVFNNFYSAVYETPLCYEISYFTLCTCVNITYNILDLQSVRCLYALQHPSPVRDWLCIRNSVRNVTLFLCAYLYFMILFSKFQLKL